MVSRYIEIVIQLSTIGLVIAAAGLWAGAGVDTRPKYSDEQTLVGGAIWSQIIIPIGLMISTIVGEVIDPFILGYYFLAGIILLSATGVVLIVREVKAMKKRKRRESNRQPSGKPTRLIRTHDKIYYAIGIICILASILKIVELVMLFCRF